MILRCDGSSHGDRLPKIRRIRRRHQYGSCGNQLRRGQLIHRALGVEAARCVGSVDISLCIECHAGQRLTTSLIAAIFHGTEGVNDVVGELSTTARTQFKDRAPVGAVVATERGISEHIAVRINRKLPWDRNRSGKSVRGRSWPATAPSRNRLRQDSTRRRHRRGD